MPVANTRYTSYIFLLDLKGFATFEYLNLFGTFIDNMNYHS